MHIDTWVAVCMTLVCDTWAYKPISCAWLTFVLGLLLIPWYHLESRSVAHIIIIDTHANFIDLFISGCSLAPVHAAAVLHCGWGWSEYAETRDSNSNSHRPAAAAENHWWGISNLLCLATLLAMHYSTSTRQIHVLRMLTTVDLLCSWLWVLMHLRQTVSTASDPHSLFMYMYTYVYMSLTGTCKR